MIKIKCKNFVVFLTLIFFVFTVNAETFHKSTTDVTPHKTTLTTQNNRIIDDLYMVILQDEPLAMYKGGISQLTATNIASNNKNSLPNSRKLNVHSTTSKRYLSHLTQKRHLAINHFSTQLKKNIVAKNIYQYALNGFTAHLSADDVVKLKQQPDVKHIMKVTLRRLMTDSGPEFVNAPNVWNGTGTVQASLGEGVIVAVMDSGISPEHPSFAAIGGDGYTHINPLGNGNYLGECAKPEFAHYCNNKLIGIWSHPDITDEYTPLGEDPIGIDHDGHGTHVASTAVGNKVNNAPIYNVVGDVADIRFNQISGVAPHANLVSYQVCAADFGCWPDLTALAVDHAIANGIDVINYSVGGDAESPWNSIDALAFLSAREAGIHVATSAGNEGDDASTISSPANAPWVTSVAAVTHDREYSNKNISFSGGASSLSSMVGGGVTTNINAEIVYAGDFGDENCLTPFANNTFSGQIVVCIRNDIPRVEKGRNVLAGGAGGMILINDPADPTTDNVLADFHVLPAIHLNNEQGQALVNWLATGINHRANITAGSIIKNDETGDILAGFSSRGPDSLYQKWLVPSISAPGVNVYAANSSFQPHYDDNKKFETDYRFLDGTSMSSPHVAGALALINAIHPQWSPAEAQSALMLTADSGIRKTENGSLINADFFDAGAGSLRVDQAINSGLVMDVSIAQYQAADPELNGEPSELNLPAAVSDECTMTCSWQKTFTATTSSSWQASYQPISTGLTLNVSPESFLLSAGQSITLTITATIGEGYTDEYGTGQILLTPSNNNFSVTTLPVVGKFAAGEFDNNILITAHSDQGSEQITGITTIGTNDLSVNVYALAELQSDSVSLPRDDLDNGNWPLYVYDDSQFFHAQAVTVPPEARYFSVKINQTSSPDLDIYVGRDNNNNGIPDTASEIVNAACQAVSTSAIEECVIVDPEAGQYFIAIYNYGNHNVPTSAIDTIEFEWAIVGENNNQLSASYNSNALANQDIDLTLSWLPPLVKDQTYLTVLDVGTNTSEPTNVGIIPIKLYRSERFITASIDSTSITAGENFTLSLLVEANRGDSDKLTDITVTLPAGVSVVNDSHTGSVANNQITWQIAQLANSASVQIIAEFSTASTAASSSNNINISYQSNNESINHTISLLTIVNNTPTSNTNTNGNSGGSGGVFNFYLLVFGFFLLLFRLKSLSIKPSFNIFTLK